jgi:hypothetical protein
MQVTKLRATADANGLIPAGTYFSRLAHKLEDANARAGAHRTRLDDEDRKLETRHRRRSASRANTHALGEVHA